MGTLLEVIGIVLETYFILGLDSQISVVETV